MDKRDLFFCCKTGNLSRIRYLVEQKDVDIHARDKWGGTPLYYACLCGHSPVVLYLLQSGVQCDANTFDGERCLYGALTDNIRHLLKNYKVITAATMRRDKYSEFLRKCFTVSDYSDIHFVIENEKVFAHRAILACRSASFQDLLDNVWKNKTSIDVSELHMSSSIFKKVIQYLYLGEINLDRTIFEGFLAIAEHFSMTDIVTELKKIWLEKKEMKKWSVFHVKPCPSPQQDFLKLFISSLPKELLFENGFLSAFSSKYRFEAMCNTTLLVDLHIKVHNFTFFCHKVFICGRSSYLEALVTDHFSEASVSDGSEIQVITLHDIDPRVFITILLYIYTDTTQLSPENVFDVLCLADIFLLPGLKKLCASFVQENLTTENIMPVMKLARLYNLPCLENHCTEFMAKHLEEIIDFPDFQSLTLEDANEIKNRQEVDTISIIDDIRYHIDRSEHVSNCYQKHLLINELLQKLQLNA